MAQDRLSGAGAAQAPAVGTDLYRKVHTADISTTGRFLLTLYDRSCYLLEHDSDGGGDGRHLSACAPGADGRRGAAPILLPPLAGHPLSALPEPDRAPGAGEAGTAPRHRPPR